MGSNLRYFLDISYKGTAYHGWQRQGNAHTVQAEFEQALATLFRKPIDTIASGRTDTGVHARQQMVQIELDIPFTSNHQYRLNGILPKDISVNAFHEVTEEANARFSALSRSYEYIIYKRKNPFFTDGVMIYDRPLNIDLMNKAAALLFEYENFKSFSRVKTEVAHFHCRIDAARWVQEGDYLYFRITANRFLRGMVRALVGTFLEVGKGNLTVGGFRRVILAQDRKRAKASAPPEGLYLMEIKYPEHIFVPKNPNA